MRRVLGTILAVALLLGLGALAVLALPNANASLAGAPAVSAAAPEFNPDAPAASTLKWNSVALPLAVSTSQGVVDAQTLANYTATGNANTTGTSVQRVMKWDLTNQRWLEYYPQDPDLGDANFALGVKDAVMILLSSAQSSTVLSWVGDVPIQGSVHNPLRTSAWNFIMVPLDQYGTFGTMSSPTGTAATLASTIGSVQRVMKWDPSAQRWVEYYPSDPDLGDPDFAVYIGYPYMVRTGTSTPTQWP